MMIFFDGVWWILELLILVGSTILFLVSIIKVRRSHNVLQQAKLHIENSKRDIEYEKREITSRLKEELHKKRLESESEIQRSRSEIERMQKKLHSRLESLEKKEQRTDELRIELQQKENILSRSAEQLVAQEKKVKNLQEEYLTRLEQVGSLKKEEAKELLCKSLEAEVIMFHEKWIQKEEEYAQKTAKEKVAQIIVGAMQRFASEHVATHSSGIVNLPNEEMKGRIIGKEGRNIKSLEMATGMEFVIGDTPEIITISGFNPIRREIAQRSLEKLITDGRINPTRIEETVAQCEREIEDMIEEYGRKIIVDFNLQGIQDDLVTLLGKLHFRTSFSQNVLEHSVEVGLFARMIAEELGLPDPNIALRGGLLHDIGKALSAECEGSHAKIGADIAKRCGENAFVVNAIAAHHEEVPFISIYSPIVMVADTISASRPGARRETLTTYIKRLEQLETIAYSFDGVKKAYAIQAGREIRIIVEETLIDDSRSCLIARDIARKIEKEMAFPGQIKVNVIREKRVTEYAK